MEKEQKDLMYMNKEELAKWLHNNYEEISKKEGWGTQKETRVSFEKLPKKNAQVMLKLADRIIKIREKELKRIMKSYTLNNKKLEKKIREEIGR